MSRRKHTIRRNPGEHLTDRQREILGTAWNQHVNRCARISLRHFARVHNVPFATWQREFRRGAVSPVVRSVTTDNGCEFLDQRRLDRAFRAETHCTRAYASYEKGSVENCNRLVRRWHPKGTDFNRLTRRQVQQLEDWINSIHRESLNGETAHAYDSRLTKAA